MLGFIFFIPLFLGIAMGCAWAFVALWNFVHHGPPGVPLPSGAPLRPPSGSGFAKVVVAVVVILVALFGFYIWDSGTNRGYEFGYYGTLNTVKNALARVPGVASVRERAVNKDIDLEEFSLEATMQDGSKKDLAFLENDPHRGLSGEPLESALAGRISGAPAENNIARSRQSRLPANTIGLVAFIVVGGAVLAAIAAVFRNRVTPLRPTAPVPQPVPAAPTGVPFEYRSPRQWLGMPLVHIVRGRDPRTGKIPVARGVVAIGVRAHGIVAIGVIASGGLAIGSLAFGVFSIGALAVGIMAGGALAAGVLTLGSLSIGFVSAVGALAIGDIAKGSLAIGRYYTEGVTRIQLDSLWRIVNGLLFVSIGALAGMFPGFREIRRTTDATRPWSPASFRAVIGTLILFAMMMVYYCVPNLPTFQSAPPVPPSFTVAYPGDIIRPGSQGMVVTTTMPYDYMVEYTFFIRDAEGTVEIPQLGCTFAARNPPASNNGNGKPRIPIEATWALKPADASSQFPYLRFEGRGAMPANSGWWRSGSGTYNLAERFRKFRWEPHPERPKQTPFINFGIVPFNRGTGMNGTEPVGAEMFLRVEARPLSVNEPVPEYTVFDNATREQRQIGLLTDYARAERNPEYIKRKAELATLQARLKEVGETSAEAASLKREIQKASNRANYLRTELATPQPGEYLELETPELVAVKIKIVGLLATIRDFYDEVERQPANENGTRTIIVPEEIEAAGKELEAAKAERMELIKKAKDIQYRRIEAGDGYKRVKPGDGYERVKPSEGPEKLKAAEGSPTKKP